MIAIVRVCSTGCCIGDGLSVSVAAYWFHSVITSADIGTCSAIIEGSLKIDAFASAGPHAS